MNKYKILIIIIVVLVVGVFFIRYFQGEQKLSPEVVPNPILLGSPHPTIFIPSSVKPDSTATPDTSKS
ncbi:MAG: hypothetical protein PHS95_00690 [Candidatus Pacebacteria bacterium]|nr:hypothetical protein [Candidatus Paceibacterota bacterium]